MTFKRIFLISVLLLFVFLTASCVGAAEDNATVGLSDMTGGEAIIEENDTGGGNDLIGSEEITNENWDDFKDSYLDPTDAYEGLNKFRAEKGVWWWNSDDTTVTYFNTNPDNQLLPLVRDAALEETAKIRAKECAELFEHERPDGTDCFTAYPDYGGGENIARYCTAAGSIEMWKETFDVSQDQGHRRNMLHPGFTCVGIAGYMDQYGATYWVQAFGWKEVDRNQTSPQTPVYDNKMTFDDLNILIKNGADIILNNDYIYKNDSSFKEGIVIDRDMTIDGQGHSIDATRLSRIFNITSDNAVLKNIVFKNGNTDGCGGAIYSTCANLTIVNCTFENNFAYYGSALFSSAGTLTLKDCIFSDNMAAHGTIYSKDTCVYAYSTSFTDNYAMVYGGAISSLNSDLTLDECILTNNTSFDGGAVYANNSNISMADCRVCRNSAFKTGSIFLNSGTANISRTDFSKNAMNDYYYYARGSSIHSEGSDVSLSDCSFSDNYAYTGGSVSSSNGNLTVDSCSFSNDTAYVNYGVLYITDSIALVQNSNFSNGRSISTSGAIYSDKSELKIISCSLKNFTAEKGSAMFSINSKIYALDCRFEDNNSTDTGIICSVYDDLTLENCSFKNGTSPEGAAVFLNNCTLNVLGCDFIKNSASVEYYAAGAGICSLNSKLFISSSRFEDNSLSTMYYYCPGGAIFSKNCEISLVNSSLTNNSATYGGAVYLTDSRLITDGSCFEKNSAYSGAAIFSNQSYVNLKLTQVCNHFQDGWGVIYCENSNIDMSGSSFSSNRADRGGVVYSVYGNITAADSTFSSNTASSYGGALYSYDAHVSVFGCNFTENAAESDYGAYGGAIFVENAKLNVADSSFNKNFANNSGGAIYSDGYTEIKSSAFSDNIVENDQYYAVGGAVSVVGNGSFKDCIFKNNLANTTYTASGASLYLSKGNVSVSYCNFSDNHANMGASICCDNGDMKLSDSNFHNEYANEGGSVYLSASSSEISNSNFTNSHAGYRGGSISLSASEASIDNCRFMQGSAYLGGAISCELSNVTVSDSHFSDNSAEFAGGAVYSSQANTTLTDSQFSANTASIGGCAYECDALRCTFENNYASSVAAAIYGANNLATDCIFTNNTAFGDNPTFNTTTKGCTFTANRILKRAQFDIEYLPSEFYQGNQLFVYLYSGYYEYIYNVTVILKAFKGNELVQTFEYIISDGWTVDIGEGDYVFEFEVKEPDYVVSPVNATVKVLKKEMANVNIDIGNVTYSLPAAADITSNVGGTADVYVNEWYLGNIVLEANRTFSFSLPDFSVGSYTLSLTIVPTNPNIDQKTFKKDFNVIKKPTSVVIEVEDGINTENVIINVTSSEKGNAVIKAGNIVLKVYLMANVKTPVDLGILEKGSYSVEAVFSPGENYIESSDSKNIRISAKISQEDIKITPPAEGSKDIVISLPADAKGKVTLSIAGENYDVDVIDGKANVVLPDLAGDNPYTITYSGDDQYAGFSISGNLNPDTDITISPDMKIVPLDGGIYQVMLPNDAAGSVTLTINNKNYDFDVLNGAAIVVLPELENGRYAFSIAYSGDNKYGEASESFSVEIINPSITAGNVKVTYSAGSYYQITVLGFGGKPAANAEVVIKSNGKKFKTLKAGSDGICKFKVDMAPGTYKLQIASLGISAAKTLTVKHLMSLKKVTVKRSAKNLVLQATLAKINGKYLKNKKITFKFNGKKYTAKTDKKGVAKVTLKSNVLKKLKVSKKVTYQATYLKDTVKYSIKVKK